MKTTRQAFANLIDVEVSAYDMKDVEDLMPVSLDLTWSRWRVLFDAEMTFIGIVPRELAAAIVDSINAGARHLPSDGTGAA